jgi:hypothetical protein
MQRHDPGGEVVAVDEGDVVEGFARGDEIEFSEGGGLALLSYQAKVIDNISNDP